MGTSNETRELKEQAKKGEGCSLAMRTLIAIIVSVVGLVYLVMTRQ